MLSANQFASFFNQPYLQNKSVKLSDFLHVDTNSHKSKVYQNFFGWAWSKMGMTSLVIGLSSSNSLYLKNHGTTI